MGRTSRKRRRDLPFWHSPHSITHLKCEERVCLEGRPCLLGGPETERTGKDERRMGWKERKNVWGESRAEEKREGGGYWYTVCISFIKLAIHKCTHSYVHMYTHT